MSARPIFNAARAPVLFVMAIWLGFLLQNLGFFEGCRGAIVPLSPQGLSGIFLSPFLHGSWEHLLSNSLPAFALLYLLYLFYPVLATRIFLTGGTLTGLCVWLLPLSWLNTHYTLSCTIGASGVIYMLAFFLFFSGVFRRNARLMIVSALIALFFGGMVWGIFPEEFFRHLSAPSQISWESHLSGAVVGILLAWVYRKQGEKKKKFIWEYPNYYSEKDDRLWQEYREKHPEDFAELPKPPRITEWDRLDEIRNND